jgi:putative transposase
MVVRSWQQNWARVIPMFSFTPKIRKAIYTTNMIQSLDMTLRKIIKNRAMFPSDEAVFKILYLALKNISKKWTMSTHDRSGAMNQFAFLLRTHLFNYR